MGCVDWGKFKLEHHDPDRFHRSEWDDHGNISAWYLIYRILLAALMVTGVVLHIHDSNIGAKWLIYMTDQGITLITLHYVLHAVIVLFAKIRRSSSNGHTMPFIYKLSWGLESMASTTALFITLIYWTMLHPTVIQYKLLKTAWDQFLNFFLHGFNTVSYIIDIFISGRPIRIHHFYFAIIYGVCYAIFSIIYWAAGGTGRCSIRCMSLEMEPGNITEVWVRKGMCQQPECDKIVCDNFIYPITDWSCNPGMSLAIVAIGMAAMPIIQFVWWLLHKLRLKLSRRCGSARFADSS